MMTLLSVALVILLFLASLVSCKPVGENYISEISSAHFGKVDNFRDVQVPTSEGQNFANNHPHKFILDNDGSGNYHFEFDTPDLKRYETGELKNVGSDNEIQVVRGQYIENIADANGMPISRTIGYIADENGFRPFVIKIQSGPPSVPRPPKYPSTTAPSYAYAYVPPQATEISSHALGSLIGGNVLG